MVLTVKAYLQTKPTGSVEIRRFVLVGSLKTNFNEFRDKLGTLFPSLYGTNFSITWNDEEGDCIVMSSDEEFAQAVASTGPSDLLKVYLNSEARVGQQPPLERGSPVKSQSKSPPGSPKQARSDSRKPNEENHPNIVCDGCNGSVRGSRFKCLECIDFDLCQKCFADGIHPSHDMIRIVSATGMMHTGHWFMPMRHIWHKLARKAAHQQEKAEAKQAKLNARMAWGSHRYGHGKWQETDKCDPSKPADYCRWRYQPQSEETAEGAAKCSTDGKSDGADFLKRIGETVASFLDPLGIDVLIDVETKETKPEDEVKRPASSDSASTSMETDSSKDEPILKETPKPTNDKPLAEDASKSKHEESPESEWTLINNSTATDSPATAAVSAPPPEENMEIPEATSTTQAKEPVTPLVNDYLNMPSGVPPSAYRFMNSSTTLYPTLVEDPKVTESLFQMISMGYSNEGGWLSALLKAKNGDIASVLDVLHPHVPPQ